MGIGLGSLRFMNQTHSAEAVVVGPRPDPAGADVTGVDVISADALISDDGSVPLAVMVADCVPVVLSAAGSTGATAVVHAGRQGVLGGIVANTVAMLRSRGARQLSAWIGPSICGKCYEVPAEMRDEVAASVPAAWATTSWGTPGLNLPAAVKAQLNSLQVEVMPVGNDPLPLGTQEALCTLENPSLYSHRRSPDSGRFAGLVWNQ